MPLPRTALIGRDQEVAAAAALLARDDVALVTVIGPGGVGKTRLALHVAASLAAQFADGVAFVSLAALRDPELVAPTLAQALGVLEGGAQPASSRLHTALRERDMLLVLDNFEQVIAAAPLVAELLTACPGLKALVTSRVALRVSMEHVCPVAPLALPNAPDQLGETLGQSPAIQLFVERARAAQPAFALTPANAAAIADICRRLDGLPLAIELAAARVRPLPPEAMLARLDSSLRVLTGGPRDAPLRQQTLRSTLDWSYELLSPSERRLFRRLAVFAGGWTLEAAEAVCPGDGDVVDGVTALVEHSLVEPRQGSPRYGFLETVREFAREALVAEGELVEASDRHAAYFTAFVQALDPKPWEPDQRQHLRTIEADLDNVRTALAWTIERAAAAAALRIGGALWWFWLVRGHASEGRRWLEAALRAPRDAPWDARAEALLGVGALATDQADYATARTCLEACRELCDAHGDIWGVAKARYGLGRMAMYAGDAEQAAAWLEEGVALDRQSNGDLRYPGSLINLGHIAYQRGDHGRAQAWLEQALNGARARGNIMSAAIALGDLGQLALDGGDVAGATERFADSLALTADVGDLRYVPQSLEGCALVAAAVRHGEQAATLFAAAAALRERISVPVASSERDDYERQLADTRAMIGDAAFDAAWARGRALSPEDAIACALTRETPPAPPPPALLSPRERDVLRLITEGQTDREIAEALFISYRTVTTHVTNILNKLGVESRTAAATRAVRDGLV